MISGSSGDLLFCEGWYRTLVLLVFNWRPILLDAAADASISLFVAFLVWASNAVSYADKSSLIRSVWVLVTTFRSLRLNRIPVVVRHTYTLSFVSLCRI